MKDTSEEGEFVGVVMVKTIEQRERGRKEGAVVEGRRGRK